MVYQIHCLCKESNFRVWVFIGEYSASGDGQQVCSDEKNHYSLRKIRSETSRYDSKVLCCSTTEVRTFHNK